MPNRREFLKNVAGASAGVIFTGCGICNAMAAGLPAQAGRAAGRREVMVGNRRVKTVDMHCHVTIPEAADLLKGTKLERLAAASVAPGGHNTAPPIQERIRAMDEMGIDVQAMSINSYWYSADKELASRLVDLQNEKLSALCASHPDRFVAFAAVALQFPELAAQQLETGMKKWGLRGAAIGGNCQGEELSSPKFDPFWAKAEELQAPIFVHPQFSAQSTGISEHVKGNGVLANVIGNPLETTIFLSHMIFEGTLDKFPNLKICAAHGGGYLGSYPDRMDHGCFVFPAQCNKKIQMRPSEYLKKIYVDSLVFTPEGLRHLVAVMGAGNIGLGTDYPFPWSVTPVDQVMALPSLSDADRAAILGGTMCRLLKIPS
ncbi:MAG TPA: amidohydrolase family protein [Candidatus Dormibacteraeota bacterium]|nr:amidohydrolase family protein [Candidatus Dormibacteraeota bacterium]